MRQLLVIAILILPLLCDAQDYVLDNEVALLEFETSNQKRLVIAKDTNDNYLVYRFGNRDRIELEFPSDKNRAWKEFKFSWYLRGGGIQNEGLDLNYLYFEKGKYRYVVYEESSAHSQQTDFGIKVIKLNKDKITYIKAVPASVKGSLMDLRYHEKITQVD